MFSVRPLDLPCRIFTSPFLPLRLRPMTNVAENMSFSHEVPKVDEKEYQNEYRKECQNEKKPVGNVEYEYRSPP